MRCRTARRAIAERGLSPCSAERQAALESHLRRCPACATQQSADLRLIADLSSLRRELPREIDVTARVLSRVRRIEPVERDDVPGRQLGWAAAAAVVGVLLATAAFVGTLPELPQLRNEAADLVSALVRGLQPLQTLLRTLLTVAAIPFRLLRTLLGGLGALGSVFRLLQPAAASAVALGYVAMGIVVTFVVARDLRRRPRSF